MGATAAVVATIVAAAGTTYSAVNANQQVQHAKGAAEAQQTAMNDQVSKADAADAANKKAMADKGSATQSAALAAIRASLSASSGMGGSITSSPAGAAPAPTQTKTLLGI